MRTIRFRGKSRVNVNYLGEDEPLVKRGEWVYGSLIFDGDDYHHIHTLTRRGWEFVNVEAETIGQSTGLLDCEGRGIYEGDILEVEGMYAKVVWNKEKASFEYDYLHPTQIANTFYEFNMPYLSIVGNIYDNPELLEVRK